MSQAPPAYVRVAVARPLPEPLTYAVPAHLGAVGVGHVVLVPLGHRGGETGYVVELTDTLDFDPARVKPILRVIDPIPAFDAEQLGFFRWIASYYLAPLGLVIHTALPSTMAARVVSAHVATEAGIDALTDRSSQGEQAQVLREIISRPGLTRRGLVRRLSDELEKREVERALDALIRAEHVAVEDREVGEASGRVRTVALAGTLAQAEERLPRLGKRMRAVLAALEDAGGTIDLPDLVQSQGGSARDALKRLEEAGLVELDEREKRDPLRDAPAHGAVHPPPLNAHQTEALAALSDGSPGTFVLFGVTGSGKTEVFLGAARAALDRSGQVLVLVPEIGLTPQLVGRFRARFGDDVAVLHSGLTGGERLAQWRRIRAGEARVAVGARSALFAPFQSLGLIVVDEEHDDSYKQDEGVPYNARDCAVLLGHRRGCPVVLASATPALETWYNARTGRYTLLRLPERATPRPVPEVELVDLTELPAPGEGQERPMLAPQVEAELRETFARGGQAIVLYNRRGFATMVECTACGGTFECPNCGITMTLHRRAWKVVCHYCGLKRPYSDSCPVCQADALDEKGKGTERIEAGFKALFPDIPTARMDADTTAARGAHERILTDFRERRTRLLIGTQIVAKGHDFPDVQTGVVISADRGFRMPDFRAAERTWALLVQLAGRAGRGDHPGRVLVQTWSPDHYVLRNLDRAEGFYDAELRLRSTLRYPPFTRLCLVRLDGVDRTAVRTASDLLGSDLRKAARGWPGVDLLGPAPAALPRLVGRWRFQLVVRGAELRPWRDFLDRHHARIRDAGKKGVRVAIDVDPRHLM